MKFKFDVKIEYSIECRASPAPEVAIVFKFPDENR